MTVFKHEKDDVVITVRFRADVWKYLDALMHNRKYNPKSINTHLWKSHLPTKSVHTVLDELLYKLMELRNNDNTKTDTERKRLLEELEE